MSASVSAKPEPLLESIQTLNQYLASPDQLKSQNKSVDRFFKKFSKQYFTCKDKRLQGTARFLLQKHFDLLSPHFPQDCIVTCGIISRFSKGLALAASSTLFDSLISNATRTTKDKTITQIRINDINDTELYEFIAQIERTGQIPTHLGKWQEIASPLASPRLSPLLSPRAKQSPEHGEMAIMAKRLEKLGFNRTEIASSSGESSPLKNSPLRKSERADDKNNDDTSDLKASPLRRRNTIATARKSPQRDTDYDADDEGLRGSPVRAISNAANEISTPRPSDDDSSSRKSPAAIDESPLRRYVSDHV